MRISDWSSDVCASDLVDRVEQSLDAHGGVREVDEKEAGTIIRTRHHDADRRALRTGNEGLAAVDDPVVAIAAAAGLHHGGVRAGAAFVRGLAHEKGRARASRDERFEDMSLLLPAPPLHSQINIDHGSA